MTETLAAAPRTGAGRPDPTVGVRRVTAAVALPVAFACQLVANALYAQATMSGLSDTGSSAETLAFYRAFADLARVIAAFALVGCVLAVPGVLAALRVLRPARPRLALTAASLMIAGYVCYFGIVTTTFDTVALATLHPDAGDVLDAAQSPAAIVVFLVFAAGNLVGTALFGLAVILGGRRAGVPWWAGVLIMCWTVGHVINITGGGEWFAVGGGALEVIGLSVVAAAALRTSNADWAARG